ncbi:hypothetical protein Lesp02_28690 [Lentzea sp. NBRC 105346]|uniref:glycohydrolase toxin TNT-related protein n=1 Tax=Lentzea sp. NBRC 105346 TaxID=3032205 RepID=UPI002553E6B7|nr:glycohydrolase toxin TNT-related protein [Lentzea sp. NBRC 105346]GLZ30680.1 hypothetical protein Lesp02_28690 [Lentzea sp. NBRC 105346]
MTTAYADPRPISDSLQAPEIDKASLNDVLDNCGWGVQSVNWIFEQVTGESLVETIITPITGDWSKIRADGDAWRNVGNAMNDMSYNLTDAVGKLRDSWDGDAAKAHERYIALGWKAGLFAEMGVAQLIAKGFDTVAEGAEALGRQAAKLLDYLVNKLIQAAATVWIPVAGWVKAAEMVWNAYQIYRRIMDIIETVKKLITDVKALFDAVGRIASALGKLKDADSLADAMNATQEVAEGVRDVRNSVNDIKDDAGSIKDSATEIRDRGRDIGHNVRHAEKPHGDPGGAPSSSTHPQSGPAVSTPPTTHGGGDTTPSGHTPSPGGPAHTTPPTHGGGDTTHASTATPPAPPAHHTPPPAPPTHHTPPPAPPTHHVPPPAPPAPQHTPPRDTTTASSAAPAAPAHPAPAHTPAPAHVDSTPAHHDTDSNTRMSGSLDDHAAPPAPKVHDDVPGVKYHDADAGGIQHRDADGKPVALRNIQHPEAGLVNNRDIALAQADPNRQALVDKPGLPADHPDVKRIVPDDYDRHGGKGEDAWKHEYVKSTNPDGTPNYNWPDPVKHPEGFASPEARRPVVLEPGSTIDRFGPAGGRFLSPPDTSFPERGLPPTNLDDGYHRYVVEKPIPVWMGEIAPAMGQPGGGIQFLSQHAVADLVLAGYLREI